MAINQYQAAKISLRARLDSNARDTPSGCREWTGATTAHGYGRMSWRNQVYRTHRLAAHLWLGMPLDSPEVVRHSCDNPPCFNPDHLLRGSQAENVDDMMARGRWRGGDKPHTHCPEGHLLEGYNIKTSRSGKRRCRKCAQRSSREYYERRKARDGAFWRSAPATIRALDGEQ